MAEVMIMKIKKVKDVEEITGILKGLLENRVVDGLIVPQESDGRFYQSLVVKADMLDKVEPFMPVFNVNTANFIKNWVGTNKKIGVLLKPCELRAVVELIKLKQIDRDKVFLIGTDCFGAFTVEVYNKEHKKVGTTPSSDQVSKHKKDLRKSCLYCTHHVPTEGDMVIGRLGKGMFVGGLSEKGLDALKDLELKDHDIKEWQKEVHKLDESGKKTRDADFKKIQEKLKRPEGFQEVFEACIGCQNCRVECPICYCKTCYFEKPLANPSADEMIMLSDLRDGLGLPMDTLFFHLVRMNHMAISCVGCGMCDDSCPKGIPVSLIFETIGDDVQKEFGYDPGCSLEEPIPLTIYKEDDKEPYGGAH